MICCRSCWPRCSSSFGPKVCSPVTMKLGLCQFGGCCWSLRASCSSAWLQNLLWDQAVGQGQPSHGGETGMLQPSTLLIRLSNNRLVFLDRGKADFRQREAPGGCVSSSPKARCQVRARVRDGVPGAGRGRSRVRAAGGTMFCLCSFSGLEEQTGKWFFCSLIAAHKQSASFSRCCSQCQR